MSVNYRNLDWNEQKLIQKRLKACPLCGKKSCFLTTRVEKNKTKWWHVECKSCGCSSGGHKDYNDAAARWNVREGPGDE